MYQFVRARNLLNLKKKMFLQWTCMFLYIRKTWFWWFSWSFSLPVLAFIADDFWHRFWHHFGSLLASIFMTLGDRFPVDFGFVFLSSFDQKWVQKMLHLPPLFPHFFDSVPHVVFLKVTWLTLASFGPLLVPCFSFWIPCLIHYKSFKHKKNFRHPSPKAPAKQSHTPSPKELHLTGGHARNLAAGNSINICIYIYIYYIIYIYIHIYV